jgi:hypothetical protein
MRPDATGIQQTHRKKSIRYSSRYCSVVGFAPPLRHCGLAARRRHAQSPVPETSHVARCLGRLTTPPVGRSPRSAAYPSRVISLRGMPELPRASRRPLLTCLKRERGGERRCIVKRLRQVGKKGGKKKKEKERKKEKIIENRK